MVCIYSDVGVLIQYQAQRAFQRQSLKNASVSAVAGMDLTLRKIAENKDYKVAWFPDSGFWQMLLLHGSGSP